MNNPKEVGRVGLQPLAPYPRKTNGKDTQKHYGVYIRAVCAHTAMRRGRHSGASAGNVNGLSCLYIVLLLLLIVAHSLCNSLLFDQLPTAKC